MASQRNSPFRGAFPLFKVRNTGSVAVGVLDYAGRRLWGKVTLFHSPFLKPFGRNLNFKILHPRPFHLGSMLLTQQGYLSCRTIFRVEAFECTSVKIRLLQYPLSGIYCRIELERIYSTLLYSTNLVGNRTVMAEVISRKVKAG